MTAWSSTAQRATIRTVARRGAVAVGCIVATAAATYGVAVAGQHVPTAAQVAAHAIVILTATAGLAWLAVGTRREIRRPGLDAKAAETLEVLLLQALQPGYTLLEIQAIQWVTSSGQRVWAVDVLTGGISDRWVPGSGWTVGALVMMRARPGQPPEIVAAMSPSVLRSANRHRHRALIRSASPGLMVVEAAEKLLRER